MGTHPKHKCNPLSTAHRFPLQRTNHLLSPILLNVLRPFAPRPRSSWDASSERTILSLTDCEQRRESVDRTLRIPLIRDRINPRQARPSCHDEQLNLRQRTLGYATGSPGGCHPGPGAVHNIISDDHHVVPYAFLP